MDSERFDRISSIFAEKKSRRDALRAFAMATLGAGGLVVLGSDHTEAKKKRRKKGGANLGSTPGGNTGGGTPGGGDGGTSGGSRADRCGGPVGICNADPTPCGTTATGASAGVSGRWRGTTFVSIPVPIMSATPPWNAPARMGRKPPRAAIWSASTSSARRPSRVGISSVAVGLARGPAGSASPSAITPIPSSPRVPAAPMSSRDPGASPGSRP